MILSIILVVGLLLGQCSALTRQDMFAYGTGYVNPVDGSSNELTVNVTNKFDQPALLDFYAPITIPLNYPSFKIFGADIGRNVYINYNGHATFGARFGSFDPFRINNTDPAVTAIFAPFFSDNDPRRANGLIYYRLSTNPIDLNLANTLIRGRGFTTFSSTYCIIATWENLKHYISVVSERNNPVHFHENTYQLSLCTDGNDGHVIYHYLKLQWARSQDISTNYATTGWVVKAATPELANWVSPSSGTEQSTTTMVIDSNVNFAGRWMRSQPILSECSGKANGVYAKDCFSYIFCCNEKVDRTIACPAGTYYHTFTKNCVHQTNYNCLGTNFCDGKIDGRYANTASLRNDDFYLCKSQLTKLLFCPNSVSFGSSSRCM